MSVYNTRKQDYLKQLLQQSTSINKSQTNKSPTKAQYSFPKKKRFQDSQPTYCKQIQYNVPNQRSMRSTSLGFGRKNQIFEESSSNFKKPGPQTYNMQNFSVSSSMQISMGKGRKEIRFNSPFLRQSFNVPGPGTYDTNKSDKLFKPNQSFTFGKRTPLINEFDKSVKPGPQRYNINDISPLGRTFTSKFISSKAAVILPIPSNKSPQKEQQKQKPAPNLYQTQQLGGISNKSQIISRFKSTQNGRFLSQKKGLQIFNKKKDVSPGPGQYQLPSEFGYY